MLQMYSVASLPFQLAYFLINSQVLAPITTPFLLVNDSSSFCFLLPFFSAKGISNMGQLSSTSYLEFIHKGGIQTTWTEFWAILTALSLCVHFYLIAVIKICGHLSKPPPPRLSTWFEQAPKAFLPRRPTFHLTKNHHPSSS